jgi:hypothetical protein
MTIAAGRLYQTCWRPIRVSLVCEGRNLRSAACALVLIVLFYCEQELKKRWHHCPLLHRFFPTAGACRSDRLALTASCDLVIMPLRLSQSNKHGNLQEALHSASPPHGFFPRLGKDTLFKRHKPLMNKKVAQPGGLVAARNGPCGFRA